MRCSPFPCSRRRAPSDARHRGGPVARADSSFAQCGTHAPSAGAKGRVRGRPAQAGMLSLRCNSNRGTLRSRAGARSCRLGGSLCSIVGAAAPPKTVAARRSRRLDTDPPVATMRLTFPERQPNTDSRYSFGPAWSLAASLSPVCADSSQRPAAGAPVSAIWCPGGGSFRRSAPISFGGLGCALRVYTFTCRLSS